MKYIVAVSGGVDSVVLLDKLVRQGGRELVVAHFDHGIRPESADDARFVEALARSYSLPFVVKREELGGAASEELARDRRYAFLREQAAAHGAFIVTAHHADDVIETIAINLLRGTGWRGVSVLDTPGIIRPQLDVTKADIYAYARDHRLEWVEDATNAGNQYLRNRMRRKILKALTNQQRQYVVKLWRQQVNLKRQIDVLLASYLRADATYNRNDFIMADWPVGRELLRAVVTARTGVSPTRPQLDRALVAVKTAQPGAAHDVGQGVRLRFSAKTFLVQTP
ncbi:tRNA lysidine(34) synthetase TilS [Streptomyces caniscabiei]|uniref:tRNA lysidine(34) synthetase TilS n=1 Tax=Streptomyces caniscabiei TaxID=2746961 RepID=UPI0029B1A48C|nr:tRNA lysidine(34) synthetase TilS [Streptomyces caniscabiei]MDX2776513.1 tRNA lysidine(34) synthetase TilS [Streptomyces caniscabiei]